MWWLHMDWERRINHILFNSITVVMHYTYIFPPLTIHKPPLISVLYYIIIEHQKMRMVHKLCSKGSTNFFKRPFWPTETKEYQPKKKKTLKAKEKARPKQAEGIEISVERNNMLKKMWLPLQPPDLLAPMLFRTSFLFSVRKGINPSRRFSGKKVIWFCCL